jgi:hypothetical protein
MRAPRQSRFGGAAKTDAGIFMIRAVLDNPRFATGSGPAADRTFEAIYFTVTLTRTNDILSRAGE